jgi:hypothetical protein
MTLYKIRAIPPLTPAELPRPGNFISVFDTID